jgi:hypothetical protein
MRVICEPSPRANARPFIVCVIRGPSTSSISSLVCLIPNLRVHVTGFARIAACCASIRAICRPLVSRVGLLIHSLVLPSYGGASSLEQP